MMDILFNSHSLSHRGTNFSDFLKTEDFFFFLMVDAKPRIVLNKWGCLVTPKVSE